MKRVVITVLWFLILNELNGQFLRILHNLEDSAFICGKSRLKIEVENISAEILSNVQFQLNLPSGTSYITGSAVNAVEFNLSIPHQPQFSLLPFARGEKRVLYLQFEIGCELFDQVNNGILFQNKLFFRHSSGIDSLLTEPPYRIETGFLVITQVRDTITAAGNQIIRSIQILNSRLGPVSTFTFMDQHDPLKITSQSGSILFEDLQNLTLQFNGNDFIKIGDRDSLFERNESILIEEILMDTSCQARTIQSDFSVSWGCSQSTCQTKMESAEVIYTLPSGNARLTFSVDTEAPACHCEPDGVRFQMHIQNTGTRRADSILIDLMLDFPAALTESFSFVPDSFRILGNAVLGNILITDPYTGVACAPGSLAERALVSIGPILPGQQITLLGRILISPSFNGNQFSGFYNYRYVTSCKNTVSMNLNPLEYSVDVRKTQPLSHTLGTQNKSRVFKNDSTIYLHDSIRVNQTITDAPINLTLVIPCGFQLMDSSFILEGKRPAEVFYDASNPDATLIFLKYLPPFDKKLHLLSTPFRIDCDDPCLKSLGGTSRRFITSCDENKNDTLKIDGLLCSELIFNCYDDGNCSCGPRARALFGFSLDCSSIHFQIDTIPAYARFQSSFYRSNIYDRDADGNRLNDGTGKADSSEVLNNRFITGDTLINYFDAQIITDIPDYTCDSLVFLTSHDLPLVPLFAEVAYYNQQLGQWYGCIFDSIKIYTSQGSQLVCGKIVLKNETYGSGHRLSIPIDSLILHCGLPMDILLKSGDRFKVRLHYKFPGNVNDRIFNSSITNYVQLFSRPSGFLFPYSCQTQSHLISAATPGISITLPPTDIYYCNSALQLEPLVIKGNNNLSDFFKKEFRSLTKIDSIKYILPAGITLDTLWVYSSYFDASGIQLIRRDFLVPQTRPGVYFIDPVQLKLLNWDESHILEFIPHLLVDKCSALKNDKVLITFQYFISSERDSLFWVSPDVQKLYNRYVINSSLEYRLLNPGSKLDFKQSELYISSKELMWNLLYPAEDEAGYLKIELQSARGLVDQFRVSAEPTVPIQVLNPQCMVIGPFAKDSLYIFKMSGIEKSCEPDTLLIFSSWSCDSLALVQALDTCLRTQIKIPVIPAKPELELDILQQQETVVLCDTLQEIKLEFFNADKGTAYQTELFIEIPNGISLLPNSLQISYPRGSPYIPLPLPTWLFGNTYVWKLHELIPAIQLSGLPGIQTQPENSIEIKFKAQTSCEIGAPNYFIFTAKGINLCDQTTNTIRKAGLEIEIEGLTQIPKVMVQVKTTAPKACEKIPPLIEIQFEMDQPTRTEDSCLIRIPKPLQFLENSFKPIQNMEIPDVTVEETTDHWLVKFNLTDSIPAKSAIRFQFEIRGWDQLPCGNHTMQLEFFTRRNAFCSATQSNCSVFITTGSVEQVFSKNLTSVSFDNLVISEDSSLNLNIEFDILTSGIDNTSDSVLCIGLYADRDLTGMLGNNDSLLHIFTIPVNLLKLNPVYNYRDVVQNPHPLSCHYLLAMIKDPCICDPDTLAVNVEAILYYSSCDSLCFGDSIRIGTANPIAKKYTWLLSPTPCDTCPFQWYFSNSKDSIRVDSFVLELSENENCQRIFSYKLVNLPPEMGRYSIEELCKNQEFLLDAGSRKNIRWFGPGISDPSNAMQSVTVDRSLRYLLQFTGEGGCEATDTFDLYFNPDTSRFSISPDTLIAPGSQANLYVTPGYQYEWHPSADLSCSSCPNPVARPSTKTLYTVIITDSIGCKHVLDVLVSLIITDCEQLPIGIPNAFSPNGDQINDQFKIRGTVLENYRLRIANRWGEIVFESGDQNEFWDGRYQGKILSPDVFAYYLQFDCEGRTFFKKGNVSLLK